MAIAPGPVFPLRAVSSEQLQNLGKVMWDWNLCNTCHGNALCSQPVCPWNKAGRLCTFWQRYRMLTAEYAPESAASSSPALSSHDDLIRLIQAIGNGPDLTRERIVESHFSAPNSNGRICTNAADRHRAMDIAASVVFMTNHKPWQHSADFFEEPDPPILWRSNTTATAFMSEAFPYASPGFLASSLGDIRFSDLLWSLAASKLVKAGFRLEPTDDLSSHLTMDFTGRKKVIRIFHCSAALKEVLLASRPDGSRCLIPRSLALEALGTLYDILFPNIQSVALISKYKLDSDLLVYDMARYRRVDDPRVDYVYFGIRLKDIYLELQRPTPLRPWENWFQKHSEQRYMMMATMIGVFIAVIIGILGLGMSGFQAYVAYQQWKHPVKDA